MTRTMQTFLDALDTYVDARIVLHEVAKDKKASEAFEAGVHVINRDEWQEQMAAALDQASKVARQRKLELRQRIEKLVGKG